MSSIKQLASITLFFFFLSSTVLLYSQDVSLELGKPIERELSGGESHRYKISVDAGQFVYIVAVQRGVDVVVRAFNSSNAKVGEMDSPNEATGNEPLPLIADRSGDYVIEIESLNKKARSGRYEINLIERRNAGQDDRFFVDGHILFNEAIHILNEEAQDSLSRFIQKRSEMTSVFGQVQNVKQQAHGFAKIAELYFTRREFAEAARYGEKAAVTFEQAGLLLDAAQEYLQLSVTYSWLYENELQLVSSRKALSIAENVHNTELQISALNQIGTTYLFYLAEYRAALDVFYRELKFAEKSEDYRGAIGALGQIGSVYISMGDFARALEAFQDRDRLMEERKIKGPKTSYMLNYGAVYAEQGNLEQALGYFQKALTGFKALRAAGDQQSGNGVAVALGNIGAAYKDLGDYDKALEYLQQELEVRENRRLPLAENLLNTGGVYFLLGRYDEALANLANAEVWAIKTGNRKFLAMTLVEKAEVYLSKGDREKALEFGKQGIDLAERFNLPEQYAQSLAICARVYMRLGKVEDAKHLLERSVEEIEGLRTKLTSGEQERSKFFANKAPSYLLLVEVLNQLRAGSEAFETAERMKARMLLDILVNAKIDITGKLTPAELDGEQKLKSQLRSLNSQLAKMPQKTDAEKASVSDVEKRVIVKRLELEDLETKLYSAHPELRGQRGKTDPITLAETGSLLPDENSALVEYAVAEGKTFLFVITRDSAKKALLNIFSVDVKDKDLASNVEAYRDKLAAGDPEFHELSRELYDLLLKPAAGVLTDKTNLIIVPDGPLWNLPFQALQNGNNKYLMEQAAISFVPSLTALREMQKKAKQRKSSPGAELIAFGNPIVAKETTEKVQRVFMGEKLEPIPEAERLVNELGKMYGSKRSKVFVGDAAREETAKTEAPKYRIVQFATHGILNNVSPMYSHLVLAQDEKNPNEDGLLEAWEMKDLDLKADMVILSACDTARGRISNGEGVIGMSWALFIAGTPTTVASQWKVESSSTTELMLEFHRQLLNGKGISKAEALRRAELKLLRTVRYKHPVYWAGFVLVGDGS